MIKIAIASGKGGTGKTFIATNIFHTLITKGIETVLVDCDAEAPNASAFFETNLADSSIVSQMVPVIDPGKCAFCGKCHDFCNYNAIFILPDLQFIRVIENLCHDCGACLVACEYNAITEKPVPLGIVNTYKVYENKTLIEGNMNPGVMSPVPVIKTALKKAIGFQGIQLRDSPPGTSCPFIQTTASADYVILVTEPTPFGLSDLKQSIETLKEIDKPYGVIINRAGIGNREIYKWLEQNNVELLMEIPFDREIAKVCSEGRLLDLHAYGDQFLDLINRVHQRVTVHNVSGSLIS
jgi:MinD superfamily P-loop ATPase